MEFGYYTLVFGTLTLVGRGSIVRFPSAILHGVVSDPEFLEWLDSVYE